MKLIYFLHTKLFQRTNTQTKKMIANLAITDTIEILSENYAAHLLEVRKRCYINKSETETLRICLSHEVEHLHTSQNHSIISTT